MKKTTGYVDEFKGGVEEVFNDLGVCVNDTINIKEKKYGVIKSIFNLSGSITKLAFKSASAVVINTPKAVVAISDIKNVLVDSVEEGVREYNKQQKENCLDEKIRQLKINSSKKT
jgi:hypothetical protein